MSFGSSGNLTETVQLSSIAGNLHGAKLRCNGQECSVELFDGTDDTGKSLGHATAGGLHSESGSLPGNDRGIRFAHGLYCKVTGSPTKLVVYFTKG